jgi:hypothetical protein
MIQTSFPSELLKRSEKERLLYFRTYTVAHPLLKEIYSSLIESIREPAGASMIFIYGPTGVGKTTLRLRIEKHLKEASLPELEKDPGHIPVVGIEAVAADSGNFSWRDYYKRALIALEEPLIDSKIRYGARGISRDLEGQLEIHPRVSGTDLRYALENALKYRKPKAFLVDEAQHLIKMSGGRKLQDQLDSIKSLANIATTTHVLLGTYDLLPFRNLSAQLSRRSVYIHFRRYHADSKPDLQAFKSVLFSFQHHIPLLEEPNLMKHWQYCYERSIGCVGILKDWLMRAYATALDEGSKTLTLRHLERQAISLSQCEKLAKEAIEGESELTDKKDSRLRLLALLGLDFPTESNSNEVNNKDGNYQSSYRKTHQVGKRKPNRDRVGV